MLVLQNKQLYLSHNISFLAGNSKFIEISFKIPTVTIQF